MEKEEKDQSQKSALGKGLAEVLARGPEAPAKGKGDEAKDVKTQAQEFLLSVESRIKTVSGKDVDITDVEIEYLQARTAFAVGNYEGTLEYLEKIQKFLGDLEKEAEEKESPPPPPEEEESPPPPNDDEKEEEEEDIPPPPEENIESEAGDDEKEGGEEELLPEDQPMIFCMMCGDKITEDSLFCSWCGEKVD